MNFEHATKQILSAIAAEDLDALKQALDARADALAEGDRPSMDAIEAGERALLDLAALKQRLAVESSKLGRIRTALSQACPLPHVDCTG